MINRLIFILAFFGIIVCFQLWLVDKLEFKRGCFGIGLPTESTEEEELSCAVVAKSEAGEIMRIPNPILGFIFYSFIATISLLKIFSTKFFLALLRKGSLIIVCIALLMSIYFTYCQFFKICALCPLCLTSACLVLILFILHLVELIKGKKELSFEERVKELWFFVIVIFVGFIAILADLIFLLQVGLI